MSSITVAPLEPERFAVEVREGDVVTNHKVALHEVLVDDLDLDAVDRSEIVRQAFVFLLERETAAGIWEDFPLEQVAEHYPDFYDDLLTRLAA